jgi:hypothetical protein
VGRHYPSHEPTQEELDRWKEFTDKLPAYCRCTCPCPRCNPTPTRGDSAHGAEEAGATDPSNDSQRSSTQDPEDTS